LLDGRLTVRHVISAELIKVGSLRSMAVATVIAALSIVVGGVLAAIGTVVSKSSPDGGAATPDPAGGSLTGVSIAVYAVATLGVLAVTSEYTTGTIKPTLAAVPRRGLLVAGKAAAVAAVTFAVTLTSTLVAFFAAKAILATAVARRAACTPASDEFVPSGRSIVARVTRQRKEQGREGSRRRTAG
jgi:hypothetical protein